MEKNNSLPADDGNFLTDDWQSPIDPLLSILYLHSTIPTTHFTLFFAEGQSHTGSSDLFKYP